MDNENLKKIYEQIESLEKVDHKSVEIYKVKDDNLPELLKEISDEIQRVLDENNLTQDELCKKTNMSQSNISKILNGKIVPRIETLQKIANATQKKLVISFEDIEGEEF